MCCEKLVIQLLNFYYYINYINYIIIILCNPAVFSFLLIKIHVLCYNSMVTNDAHLMT